MLIKEYDGLMTNDVNKHYFIVCFLYACTLFIVMYAFDMLLIKATYLLT